MKWYGVSQEKKAAITIPFGGKRFPLLRSTRVSAGLRRRFIARTPRRPRWDALSPYGVRDFPVIAPYTDSVARTDPWREIGGCWMDD